MYLVLTGRVYTDQLAHDTVVHVRNHTPGSTLSHCVDKSLKSQKSVQDWEIRDLLIVQCNTENECLILVGSFPTLLLRNFPVGDSWVLQTLWEGCASDGSIWPFTQMQHTKRVVEREGAARTRKRSDLCRQIGKVRRLPEAWKSYFKSWVLCL